MNLKWLSPSSEEKNNSKGDGFITPKYPGKYLESILPSGWKYRPGEEKETRGQVDLESKRKTCKVTEESWIT